MRRVWAGVLALAAAGFPVGNFPGNPLAAPSRRTPGDELLWYYAGGFNQGGFLRPTAHKAGGGGWDWDALLTSTEDLQAFPVDFGPVRAAGGDKISPAQSFTEVVDGALTRGVGVPVATAMKLYTTIRLAQLAYGAGSAVASSLQARVGISTLLGI